MSARARVALVGAGGRMGRLARGLLEQSADFELAAAIERGDDLSAALRASGAELGLDFTVAGLGAEHGFAMIACAVRPVIGTSGVSLEQNDALDRAARAKGLGGLVVPNFSLGVWLLVEAAERAARFYARAEIVEMHHADKLDAPSGTALYTAERMAAARGTQPAAIPIHSVRLPGLYSNQEVMLGGPGELLRLRHETYSPACFSPGILAALRYARGATGVGRGIGLAFEAAGE